MKEKCPSIEESVTPIPVFLFAPGELALFAGRIEQEPCVEPTRLRYALTTLHNASSNELRWFNRNELVMTVDSEYKGGSVVWFRCLTSQGLLWIADNQLKTV